MDEERLTRAASIFPSAADLAPADGEAFLSEQCGDDAELRSLVERLLAIGPYRILDKLGEGGFGEVMDTKEVLARFEAERHALAMMDHPNIVRVLDAGEMPQGRPDFVMELTHGEPLAEYCGLHPPVTL